MFIATIKANVNGVSINPDTMKAVNTQSGYFVSITDNYRIKADYRIVGYLRKKANELGLKKWFIGYWKDEKTGKNYFDISLLMKDKVSAMIIGRECGQKAIFGVNEGVIYL